MTQPATASIGSDAPAVVPLADVELGVRRALDEDVGVGDLTAELIPAAQPGRARVITRDEAVLCGQAWFERSFTMLDPRVQVRWSKRDGEAMQPGDVVCEIDGPARALVTGERTALNFLQTLSGTATVARRYADCLTGTHTRLLDTRKTIPGLRAAQKYAVRCGGGRNHRHGLYDAILIKENHIEAAGSVPAAIAALRAAHGALPIETEVESLAELAAAIEAGADIVLLDNFTPAMMREAVALAVGRVKLEASGGFTFEDLRSVAETGVDYISVGGLTKHLRAVDFSMRFLRD
ncbi:MAG: carboxylating nicotinate-nucleotide diphosphorylase [Gammaproteobacteria bacterium]|nr:carboxylating nicotinate-nucleotide diphosphorylase [Gammaproteobacteria bacterium]MBI5615539.1 carboxylating nicotinate-nucleotide diphosphorylase [Gammaproteobacteria bacterium]